MKKFLGLLIMVLMFSGCDDGDMTIETISFEDVQAASCGETIYKLNGNEALYMKIPTSANAFPNNVTPVGIPKVIDIDGAVSVTYRAYNGPVTRDNLCNTPAPISPVATQEWIATSGKIEITTIAVYTAPDEVTGATQILKYIHNIVFKNIVFAKPDGNQVYETFPFGEYSTNATTLPFDFIPEDSRLCSSGPILYNARTNGIEALFLLNFDTTLLDISILNTPKTGLLSDTQNRLIYRLLYTAITTSNEDYFCNGGFFSPGGPAINEEWEAQDGIADTSGIVEVVTTTNGSGYLHTITLKEVTFQKDNNTFYLGNSYVLGTLLTAN